MAVAQVVGAKEWEDSVLKSDIPVFVDFWAEWCGPCRMVGPTVEELAADYDGRVNFVKINVDHNQDLGQQYGIFSIPTLAVFSKGKMVSQQVGAASKETYKGMIDKALEPA